MARPNPLQKNVPRVELDARAGEARDGLVRLERLLAPRADAPSFWRRPLARFVGLRLSNGRQGSQTGGSVSDRLHDRMPETDSAGADRIDEQGSISEATKSPAVAARCGAAGSERSDPRCVRGQARPSSGPFRRHQSAATHRLCASSVLIARARHTGPSARTAPAG
jgi:hypothetical protein